MPLTQGLFSSYDINTLMIALRVNVNEIIFRHWRKAEADTNMACHKRTSLLELDHQFPSGPQLRLRCTDIKHSTQHISVHILIPGFVRARSVNSEIQHAD
jgi:hypothetical protein